MPPPALTPLDLADDVEVLDVNMAGAYQLGDYCGLYGAFRFTYPLAHNFLFDAPGFEPAYPNNWALNVVAYRSFPELLSAYRVVACLWCEDGHFNAYIEADAIPGDNIDLYLSGQPYLGA